MKKILVLAAVLVIGVTSFAYAGIDRGTWEFGVNGFMDKTETKYATTGSTISKNENTSIGINTGYFLAKKFQLGALVSYDSFLNTTTATRNEGKSYGLSAQFKIYPTMDEHTVVAPYFGLQVGAYTGDSSYTSTTSSSSGDVSGKSFYALAGIKYFPVDLASLNFELRFGKQEYTNKSGSGASTDYEQDRIRLNIGASIYF